MVDQENYLQCEDFFSDYDASYKHLQQLIQSAKHSIYYSAWVLDFNDEFLPNTTFKNLINQACSRGVKTNILLASNALYPYKIPLDMHKNCHIKIVKNFGTRMNIVQKAVTSKVCKNTEYLNEHSQALHQKYIAVDNQYFMLGGTDIDRIRRGEQQTQKNDFLWREPTITVKINNDLQDFYEKNFEYCGHYTPKSNFMVGSFPEKYNEHNKIIEMINNAEKSIYIENQHIYRFGMKHQVIDTLIKKCNDFIKNKKEFTISLITNKSLLDSISLLSVYGRLHYLYTYFYINRKLIKQGCNYKDIKKYIKFYSLAFNNKPTFIHSKIMIIDKEKMLIGSSNINDRSLIYPHSDRELAFIVSDKKFIRDITENKLPFLELKNNKEKKSQFSTKYFYLEEIKIKALYKLIKLTLTTLNYILPLNGLYGPLRNNQKESQSE